MAIAAKKNPVLAGGFHRERFKIGEQRDTVLKEICPEARERFPYYFSLPHEDPIALLRWRRYARNRSIRDAKFRAAVWEACRRDFAFFCVTFVWIFEPRPYARRMPFHLFTSQVSLAAWFVEIVGVRDGAVNKTRGIGLSWLVSAFILWVWLFHPDAKIAILTEDESKLDTSDLKDSNTSIGKLQYIYDQLPHWARYKNPLHRIKEGHIFANRRSGALVQGFVSTGTKLRQLRFTLLFADEFAFYQKSSQEEWMTASGGTCNSRLLVSTWNDFGDMFDRIMYEEESSLLRMTSFWWNDYERWKGAYKMHDGRPILVDKDYKHAKGYQFGEPDLLEEGTLRSPWVDAELSLPGVDKLKTLRDLYGKSVCEQTNSFFANEIRSAVRASVLARSPSREGQLEIVGKKVLINPTKKSDIRVWNGVPEINRGPYTGFCDLGGGSGLAYSVFSVFDKSGEQVLEYGTNTVAIVEFASNVVAISRWLGAHEGDGWVVVDFDNIGPLSKSFSAEMVRQEYSNIWQSEIIDVKARRKKIRQGEIPTYYGTTQRDCGLRNFREMARAIMELECVIRSERVSEDMRRCGKDEDNDGAPKFAKPTGNVGHGDFCQAAAGAWWRLRSTVDLGARDHVEDPSLVKSREENIWTPKAELWSEQYSA